MNPVLAAGLFVLGLAAVAAAQSDPQRGVGSRPIEPVTIRPAISEARGLVDFDLDGNGVWKVTGDALVLEKAGVPGGPIRRPAAIAILKSQPLSDLTLALELKSTAPVDLEVRDVLLIAGYRSPTEFYYVHISRKTDAVHNGIFLVNHADRKRLDAPSTRAPLTDANWHTVRLERNAATGSIHVLRCRLEAVSVGRRSNLAFGSRRRRIV